MKKYHRLASGLTGLGIMLTVGMGPGVASAESLGRSDDATSMRVGQVAVAWKTTKTGSTKSEAGKSEAGKTGTALGLTGAAGTKTFRISTANAVAVRSHGRADDASRPVGLAALFSPKPQKEQAPASTTKRPYHAQIVKHANANGVPVALALAVVRVESNYNPGVRGRAGEVGLMQIKPQTARGMGFSGSTKALYDPETNLRWGMKYLAGAYQRAGGDTCGTIMRYQGGHYARRMSKVAVGYCSKVKRHMAGTWA